MAEDTEALEVVAAPEAQPVVLRRQRLSDAEPMIFGIAREELELTSWTARRFQSPVAGRGR